LKITFLAVNEKNFKNRKAWRVHLRMAH
jgi:hypothetical protein